MSIDLFYRPSKSCWRVPTRYCFALRANTGALKSVHDADVCPNDSGIDGLNEILRSLISYIDQVGRKIPHQIPIACTLI
jgi:hypothetical protein